MGLSDVLTLDLVAMIADFPQTLTSGGETRRCAAGEGLLGKAAMAAGMRATGEIEAVIIDADWTTMPEVGGVVTVDGVDYRVGDTMSVQNDIATLLRLERKG